MKKNKQLFQFAAFMAIPALAILILSASRPVMINDAVKQETSLKTANLDDYSNNSCKTVSGKVTYNGAGASGAQITAGTSTATAGADGSYSIQSTSGISSIDVTYNNTTSRYSGSKTVTVNGHCNNVNATFP